MNTYKVKNKIGANRYNFGYGKISLSKIGMFDHKVDHTVCNLFGLRWTSMDLGFWT